MRRHLPLSMSSARPARGFDCDEGELGYADAGGAQRLHYEGEARPFFAARGLYEADVVGAAEFAPFVAEGGALAFEEFRTPLGAARECQQAVDRGEHDVDRRARVAARDEVFFPAEYGAFVDGFVFGQKFVETQQVAAVFPDRLRAALVFRKAPEVGFDELERQFHLNFSFL